MKTSAQAQELYKIVDRPNLLVKIPATVEGLSSITETLKGGISVNVTLIFSLERYEAVIDAYIEGVKQAKDNGEDISKLHSVASFFVSRVDTEIDKRLDAIGTDEAAALKGKAAIANARLAYQLFEQKFATDEWKALEAAGGNKQRPLWASTGVKDPSYDDTRYVVELVAPKRSTPHLRRPSTPSPTTASSAATPSTAATKRPLRFSPISPPSASTSTMCSRYSRPKASTSSSSAGTSSSRLFGRRWRRRPAPPDLQRPSGGPASHAGPPVAPRHVAPRQRPRSADRREDTPNPPCR